jgi:hypothetical protein
MARFNTVLAFTVVKNNRAPVQPEIGTTRTQEQQVNVEPAAFYDFGNLAGHTKNQLATKTSRCEKAKKEARRHHLQN